MVLFHHHHALVDLSHHSNVSVVDIFHPTIRLIGGNPTHHIHLSVVVIFLTTIILLWWTSLSLHHHIQVVDIYYYIELLLSPISLSPPLLARRPLSPPLFARGPLSASAHCESPLSPPLPGVLSLLQHLSGDLSLSSIARRSLSPPALIRSHLSLLHCLPGDESWQNFQSHFLCWKFIQYKMNSAGSLPSECSVFSLCCGAYLCLLPEDNPSSSWFRMTRLVFAEISLFLLQQEVFCT